MQQKRLAAGLVAAFAAYVQADSDVTQLTKDTFADFVKANDLVLAECKCLFLEYPAVLGSIADMVLPCSLRSLVRPLQGPCPRVRRGCYLPQGEGHQARQG